MQQSTATQILRDRAGRHRSSAVRRRKPKQTTRPSRKNRTWASRLPSLETLEPLVLFNADVGALGDLRGGDVSNFSIMFDQTTGEVRKMPSADALYAFGDAVEFNGKPEYGAPPTHIEVPHDPSFAVAEGTFAMTFSADDIFGYHGLFAKDYSGESPGHIAAFVADGRLVARLQTANDSYYLETPHGSIEAGQQHHAAVTFGSAGFWLYLDGRMMDWKLELDQGLSSNSENLVVGASTWGRSDDYPDSVSNHFDGSISDFSFYGTQFDRQAVGALAGYEYSPPIVPGRVYGTNDSESLSGNDVHGGYGDDLVTGTAGNDRLDGGHGEDRLEGGDGDDLLISRSDGREPQIAQDYDSSDDPYGEVDPLTRTLYSDQPIEADDVLNGGAGADTFRFEPLINAKEHLILKHTMDTGMIHWHGVAGENDLVHDHWVDRIGNEVIEDFNREEGDRIEIVGHTVDVYDLRHVDTDGDGVLDASVIYLQSNQGNAGAHNKDKLGTITVFGDLVLESDLHVDAGPAYGIVNTIYALDEALSPQLGIPVADDGTPPPYPVPAEGTLPPGAVFGLINPVDFAGERRDYLQIAHDPSLQLEEGTIALTFNADDVFGGHALFSKDAYGESAGHITAFVYDGRIKVRLQSNDSEVWLRSAEGSVLPGDEHHLAVTFGSDGFWLYLDGRMTDWELDFTQGLDANTETMAIGASVWGRSAEDPDAVWSEFDGTIENLVVYDSQMTRQQVADLAGYEFMAMPVPGRTYSTDADESLQGTDVHAGYGDDVVLGTSGNDRLDGGHGEDRLEGGAGDDLLVSRSDGREPQLAQEYVPSEDDPYGELNPTTRTIYPDQPIEADDVLIGGEGADTFRFEVLINAKEDIILDHVMDNGMIHWHGVAGENTYVHDHWVDMIGNEVIADFSRAQGDKIEIVGHTVDLYHIEHVDTDGDDVLDATVLYLQSNQGNAGAHNKDQLGTITVFGDLVMYSDIFVDAKPAYGIVDMIDQLDEALTPRRGTPVAQDGTPPEYPMPNDGVLPVDAVFAVNNEVDFRGEDDDYLEVAHRESLQLREGTYSLKFVADDIWGRRTLVSKDASGKGGGGHLTVSVYNGHLEARLQSASDSITLRSSEGTILPGIEYDVAVTFGGSGFMMYLDGEPVDVESGFDQGMEMNIENLVIGGNGWGRNEDRPYKVYDEFDGRIANFAVYDRQLSAVEVSDLR